MKRYSRLFIENSTLKTHNDFLKWKRKNVTLRGIKSTDNYHTGNNGMASYGSGLYTAFLGNRQLARQYGEVYFVVNAIPKHPKVVNSVNEAEIFMQELITDFCKQFNVARNSNFFYQKTTIPKEMIKLGYDGLIIKGREMVNYTPPNNVMYFKTENALQDYYYNILD